MLLILEIAMLIGGIYILFSAKVPAFLIGGGNYHVEGTAARWLGALLLVPLPVALLGGFILALLFGKEGIGYAAGLEIITVLGVAILAVVLTRVAGKRVEPVNDVEASIAKKSQGALMYAIFSAFGFTALICCPLAIMYANQALKLMDEKKVGEQHRNKAKTARMIAIVATVLWGSAVLCVVTMMMFSGTR